MTNQGDSNNPAWSPDGRSIAFNSFRNNSLALYAMDTDGKHLRKINILRHGLTFASEPAWSPDGKQPACAVLNDGNGIYIIDIDGRNPVACHLLEFGATILCGP